VTVCFVEIGEIHNRSSYHEGRDCIPLTSLSVPHFSIVPSCLNFLFINRN